MTLRPCPRPFARLLVAALGAGIAAAAVAADSPAGDWRQARVRSLSPLSAVDAAVDTGCTSAASAGSRTVMVVSYRVGKAARWRAFDLGADDAVRVGDELLVDVATCRHERMPQPQGASAP